ncbi:sensor histidine kinase RegB [Celeribacter indicus]|uniref:histidine kinase n=1 Tax=Celeribacter indicus TaxID=1208324 RepID=A0A0B5DUJ4_9RHOB|nr:sensor histidine kinase RegB [Celeribacter indicus]SDW97579.1 two-component system, sensor histidine kinase RegB [Celeribacter indicus]
MRLRTLNMVRWIAIAGQVVTLAVAVLAFGLEFAPGGFALVIGASLILNIVTTVVFPENTRLTERGATLMLLFDICQLSALLYLSGGLNNPFALLILAPVSISASALRPKSSVLIGGAAIALVTLLSLYHVPLVTGSGTVLSIPSIFLFGQWAGIVIGVVFLGVFSWRVASEIHTMSEALLATQMALTREQKLTDLGGVVAAAAHELGTPLATIKLVSGELVDDLRDFPAMKEDAQLISEQADRCRDILRSMGQAGKDDLHMHFVPLQTVVEEAAHPHMERGKSVVVDVQDETSEGEQPYVYRRPEIIHGLRNLVQNAVDFAETTVWIDVSWTRRKIVVRIIDDGTGFPASVIGRIGDPFVRKRRNEQDISKRPGYEGMGLGLFIAKTLLERTGAEISFANGTERHDMSPHTGHRSGAIVELSWPRERIGVPEGEQKRALGKNTPFTA